MKTYYKIVRSDLTSCCRDAMFDESYRVKYAINKWVYPTKKHTLLFVFNDYDTAYDFIYCRLSRGTALYECEVKKPRKIVPVWVSRMHDYWEAKRLHKPTRNLPRLNVDNCYGCEAVKLTKLLISI